MAESKFMSKSITETLEEIRQYISKTALSKEHGNFPIQKFKKILENDQNLQSQKLIITSKLNDFPETESKKIISDCVKIWVGQHLLADII
ncbi:MAG: hypothetical protein RLZ35_483, partial [Pseudomonadota bacterium]